TPVPTPTPAPDFSLTVSPSSVTVGRNGGNSAPYTVTINGSNGFNAPVTLTATGLPSGATPAFTPNPTTTGSSTLRINVSASTSRGSYNFTINGTSGGLTRTT